MKIVGLIFGVARGLAMKSCSKPLFISTVSFQAACCRKVFSLGHEKHEDCQDEFSDPQKAYHPLGSKNHMHIMKHVRISAS